MLPIIGVTVTGLGTLAVFFATLRIGARVPRPIDRK
jgi:hypothetical protein